MKKLKIPIGGIWEETEWELLVGSIHEIPPEEKLCIHAVDTGEKRYYGPNEEPRKYHYRKIRYPLVAVLKNEGGYNSTGLCLRCAIEAVKMRNLYE